MVHLTQRFQERLQVSMDEFLWATQLISEARLYLAPRENRWPVARLLFHLVDYERRLGLPSILQWVGADCPIAGTPEEDAAKEELAWQNGEAGDFATMVAEFKALREQQIALLGTLPEESWQEVREAVWGPRSLAWVVTKTYQHTLEHTDEVLRSYLWWR
ncbi:DinB family protein [Tengunoibacter tsumagoiensis]|uniref:DinB-like domain-containing protein n=1 Tax=Tengunoibacter tsumagoiensis TaxID=2014871 RepID=A0A402A5R1_9CHLR|nr:DinB family protein [Tengunoibacter tsumagoiensis]GCE14442.1 hypothetical protein KTT_43010 [Tengunoibacter tsumagoiensis]